MSNKTIPEPWFSFLQDLDNFAEEKVSIQCLGGFTLKMLYGLPRPTSDIDITEVTPTNLGSVLLDIAGEGSRLHKKHGIYLERARVNNLPENYEERLIEMFPGSLKTSVSFP